MSVLFSLNQREFEEQLRDIAAITGKSSGEVIKDEGRLFMKDVVALTPPFATSPNTESYNRQRRTGEAAVERDIRRLFRVMDLAAIEKIRDPGLKRGIKRAYRKRDLNLMKELIKTAQPDSARQIIAVLEQMEPRLHSQFRDRRGRITSPNGKFWLMHEQGLKRYITEKKRHVGKAKAGWATAARALGVKLPNWITRNSSPGEFKDNTQHRTQPSITVGNLVDYIQGAGADLQIVQRALQNRVRNMKAKLARLLNSAWKRPKP